MRPRLGTRSRLGRSAAGKQQSGRGPRVIAAPLFLVAESIADREKLAKYDFRTRPSGGNPLLNRAG